VLGRYLVLAGSIRFAIEFIRVNVRLVGPLTLAHLVSLALVIIGAGLVLTVAPAVRGRAGSLHPDRAGSHPGIL
jgi:prolipoprotein diacylglyceryltransferase